MESDVHELKQEYQSKQYSKLSDCPSYCAVKAYCEAYNTLARAYYHKDDVRIYLISPKSLVVE